MKNSLKSYLLIISILIFGNQYLKAQVSEKTELKIHNSPPTQEEINAKATKLAAIKAARAKERLAILQEIVLSQPNLNLSETKINSVNTTLYENSANNKMEPENIPAPSVGFNNAQKIINPVSKIMVTGPEQNCSGAIFVCAQSFTQNTSYTGFGSIQELSSTCLLGDETNSVWYTFTAQSSGSFGFLLTTVKDYDFALYNITSIGCSGVPSATPVRCNFSGTLGNTGMNAAAASTELPALSETGTGVPISNGISNMVAGQTYVLIIDNYSADATGYTLTFTGTASITDVIPPTINPPSSVVNNCNGTFVLAFSEPVQCSSIAANGSDFTLSGGGVITAATGVGCSAGTTLTKSVTINYTVPSSGTFILGVATGSDSNTVLDKCNNPMATTQTVTVNTLNALNLTANVSQICTAGTSVTLTAGGAPNSIANIYTLTPGGTVASSNGSGNATFVVNPAATTTYVVLATFAGCTQTASVTISVPTSISVFINPVNPTICSGTAVLTAATLVNGVVNAGATFQWSGGSSSTSASITAAPGTYSVTSVTSAGCVATNTAVSVVSLASAGAGASCNIYYVSPAGGGTGLTKTSPTTLQNALTLALCQSATIKMQTGLYTLTDKVDVNSYVTIEGGYNSTFTTKTSDHTAGGSTRIVRSGASADSDDGSGKRYTAFKVAASATAFRLQELRIEMPTTHAAASQKTNYGIYLGSGCSSYNIVRCYINAGTGGSGTPGTAGTAGGNGGNAALNVAGAAGTGGGGAGGAGGAGSTGTNDNTNGSAGTGGAGGAKSSGADFNTNLGGLCLADMPSNPTLHASSGTTGTAGTAGIAGSAGSFAAGYFVAGGIGTTGTNGNGGGGGGGAVRNTGYAENGGGGGGGGAGGTGGTGGSGAGSAFGIFSVAKGAGANVIDCEIYTTAGLGGTGAGGAGGAGGLGRDACRSGDGGYGGNGGNGGAGGAGANGLAYAVCDVVGAVATNAGYISKDLVNQPLITASNLNCTNATISLTHAVGESCTSVGANATAVTPVLPTTTTPITFQYSATGFKTITFSGGGIGDVTSIAAQTFASGTVLAPLSDVQNSICEGKSRITIPAQGCTYLGSEIILHVNYTVANPQCFSQRLFTPMGNRLSLDYGTNPVNFSNPDCDFTDAGTLARWSSVGATSTSSYRPQGDANAWCGTTPNIATFAAINGGAATNMAGNWDLEVERGACGVGSATFNNWSISLPAKNCVSGIYKTYTDFINISMAPPSSGNIMGATPLCTGITGNFASSLGTASGFTYVWSVVNPAGCTNTITASTTNSTGITFTNPLATAQIYTVNVAVTSECCGLLAAPTQYTVSVNPGPAAPTVSASANPVCPGAASNLNATAPAGAAFQWYNAAAGGTLLSSNATYSVTPAVTTTYYAQATSTIGCVGLRTPIEVTVTPTSPPTAPNITTCAPGNVTINISSPIAGATYSWYTGSCGGTLVQSSISTALMVNIPAVQINTYYVSVTAPGGCNASSCTAVTAQVTTAPTSVTWTGAGSTGLNNWFDASNWGVPIAATTYSNAVATAAISAAGACPVAINNTISISGYASNLTSSAFSINVTTGNHTFFNDLSFYLIAPNGQILGLTNNRGNGGNCALTNITFSDAGGAVMGAACPAAGSTFKPETTVYTDCATTSAITTFSAFGAAGVYNPNGIWTLRIVDRVNGDGGAAIAIGGWSISFPAGTATGCLPTCATNVTIPNTPALAVSNPPDIGFNAANTAQTKTLTLVSGNTLSFSDTKAELDICGDFTHAGTLTTNAKGKVVFMGTVAQIYNNSNARSNTANIFNDVILNNTAATPILTISNSNMTLGTLGSFIFQSGKILTTASDTLIILNGSTTAVSGHAATRYVGCTSNTNGEGNIKRYIQASGLGSYDFPVGQTTYELVNINFTTAPTTPLRWLNANFQNYGGLPPTSPAVTECATTYNMAALNNGFWDITSMNSPNNTGVYDMTLFNTGYTNASAGWSIMSRHNGSATWAMTNGSGSNGVCVATPVTAVLRQQMNGFSKFGTAQANVPLPIELLSFTAKYNGKSADINWVTASEINNDYFIVEKSTDGVDFSFLHQEDSKAPNGNSNSILNYSINDPKVSSGIYYYRLKQYDFNGTAKYSHIESITIGAKEESIFSVSPNPTSETAEVNYYCYSEEKAMIRVYDDRGRLIIENEITCSAGQNKTIIDLNYQADGLYIITLTTNNDVYKTKLVKQSN